MDYSKLRGAIREKYKTEASFAEALGVSRCTLSALLNGKTEWSISKMVKACELLDIPLDCARGYFF